MEEKEDRLIVAAQEGDVQTIKALLDSGVDVNAKGYSGMTALMQASKNNHIDCVNILLNAKAGVNIKNELGRTALKMAQEKGYQSVVKLLEGAGALDYSQVSDVVYQKENLNEAYGIIYFIGGINLLLGLIGVVFKIEAFQQWGIGLYSIIFGFVYLLLGFFVKQYKSIAALLFAFMIFIIDSFVAFAAIVSNNDTSIFLPFIIGLLVRISLLKGMYQGFDAIHTIKKAESMKIV